MKKASLIVLFGILGSVMVPGASFAQTTTTTAMTTIEQLELIIKLLQQVIALKAQLAQLQSQQTVIPASAIVAPATDPNAPVISNVSASATLTSMTMKWTTNKDTRSEVYYWAPYYKTKLVSNDTWTKTHTLTIKDLAAGTFYSVRIIAKDGLGHVVAYPDQTVKTTDTPDKTKPIISDIQVGSVTKSSALVSWKTNENAKVKLYYGTVDPLKTTATTTKSITDTSFGLSHIIFLSNLQASTQYYYILESVDVAGNKTLEVQRKFSTPWY